MGGTPRRSQRGIDRNWGEGEDVRVQDKSVDFEIRNLTKKSA